MLNTVESIYEKLQEIFENNIYSSEGLIAGVYEIGKCPKTGFEKYLGLSELHHKDKSHYTKDDLFKIATGIHNICKHVNLHNITFDGKILDIYATFATTVENIKFSAVIESAHD
jgi:hypothetical protein